MKGKAFSLLPGFRYVIDSGQHVGETITVLSNKMDEADPTTRRKVHVRFADGTQDWIMPRHINETPVGIENPEMVHVVPAPAEVIIPEVSPDLEIPAEAVAEVAKAAAHAQPITDPMDKRLDHFRPSRHVLKEYVSRTMKNGMVDTDFLLMYTSDEYRTGNQAYPVSVMIKGDTQGGKTLLVQVLAVLWADKLGLPKPMPVFTLSGSSGVTDFDLFGQVTSYTDPATGTQKLVWLNGVVTLAFNAGGILYLDESNMMGERVTSSLHPGIDNRHQFINRNKPVLKDGVYMPEVTRAHPDLWVISTLNEGYQGSGRLNEAFKNRFDQIRWDYDKTVEAKLIHSPAVLLLAEGLRLARAAKSRGLRTPIGTAALQRFERNLIHQGVEDAVDGLKAMFELSEVDVVDAILNERDFMAMFHDEARQRALEEGRNAPATPTEDENVQALRDLLDKA